MNGLSIEGLSKTFKDQIVLDEVSFNVDKGETLVLFGPSGAGKTVLLRCIAGAVDQDTGTIWIDGHNVTATPPEARGVGMAFQNFALFPHMNAFENIASPLRARKSEPTKLEESVRAIARLLKIDHVLAHAPRELSNGQKQRTALARALAAEPGLLLLDDPLRNVDAKLRFEMRLELPRLLAGREATVIYVTQDYKEAMALGNRIAVLEEGRIAQIGTAEDIYLSPSNIAIAKLFGDPVINLLDVVPDRDERGAFFDLSDQRIALDFLPEKAVGVPCTLGIRPEDFTITNADVPNALPVNIEAETPLNEKTVTLAVTPLGQELLASRPAGAVIPGQDSAGYVFNSRRILFFDSKSGLRMDNSHSNEKRSE